jgi:uncharacterized protein with FMN-binding domain
MRRVLFAIVGTVAGLVGLLSFKTHSVSVAGPPGALSSTASNSGGSIAGSGGSAGNTGSSSTSGSSPSTGSSSSSSSSGSSSTSTKTVTGDAIDTRWGPVQVRITVTNGKLTDVTAVVYPTENPRDQEINAYAIPALTKEALAAGNAQIDMISGATYTSNGYISSLQSALDKAGQ